eukprot:scaffold22109_cov63-Phaeocystis_antarctica.AAC.2
MTGTDFVGTEVHVQRDPLFRPDTRIGRHRINELGDFSRWARSRHLDLEYEVWRAGVGNVRHQQGAEDVVLEGHDLPVLADKIRVKKILLLDNPPPERILRVSAPCGPRHSDAIANFKRPTDERIERARKHLGGQGAKEEGD